MSDAVGVPPGASASVPSGTLVCVGGSPGAGKTTVGALVAAGGGLCLVDLDSVTTPLVEAFAASLGTVADLDSPQFAALRDARYACLGEVAADNLRAGRSVVAVAPFTRRPRMPWPGGRWGAPGVPPGSCCAGSTSTPPRLPRGPLPVGCRVTSRRRPGRPVRAERGR